MKGVTSWLLALFLSPVGAFVLAALDSTLFFYFPLGIDAVVMILVARRATAPWLMPLIATAAVMITSESSASRSSRERQVPFRLFRPYMPMNPSAASPTSSGA